MRVPALTARALAAFSGMQRLHRPHTTNNTNLAIREIECDVGEEVCGNSCMPEGNMCCNDWGNWGSCGPGHHCAPWEGCCPGDYERCPDEVEAQICGPDTTPCGLGCIPKGYVCCGDNGTFCKDTLVCSGDRYCEFPSDDEDEYPSDDEDETTTSSSAPGTTTTSAPTTTADAGPTTTGSETAPTGGPSDADKAKGEDKKEGDKNSASQMKLGAGGLVVALIAGAAMFL